MTIRRRYAWLSGCVRRGWRRDAHATRTAPWGGSDPTAITQPALGPPSVTIRRNVSGGTHRTARSVFGCAGLEDLEHGPECRGLADVRSARRVDASVREILDRSQGHARVRARERESWEEREPDAGCDEALLPVPVVADEGDPRAAFDEAEALERPEAIGVGAVYPADSGEVAEADLLATCELVSRRKGEQQLVVEQVHQAHRSERFVRDVPLGDEREVELRLLDGRGVRFRVRAAEHELDVGIGSGEAPDRFGKQGHVGARE